MPPSDEALVAQALSLGSTDAFDTLVRRHQRRIHHLLLRFTREAPLAEELCQETFLRAWRKLHTFRGSGAFGAWLARLAYTEFLQHRRRQASRVQTQSLDDPEHPLEPGATNTGADASEAPDLERLLAVVSEPEREVLLLSYAAGLSATEIADMLNTNPGTVKSQIHRAKEKIRRHFAIETAS